MLGSKKKQKKVSLSKTEEQKLPKDQHEMSGKISPFNKIKQKTFQIFVGNGLENQKQQGKPVIFIGQFKEFYQELMNNFSTIYNIDHQSFKWKQKVEALVKTGKQFLKLVQKIRKEMILWEEEKIQWKQRQQQYQKQIQRLEAEKKAQKEQNTSLQICIQEQKRKNQMLLRQMQEERNRVNFQLNKKNSEINGLAVQLENKQGQINRLTEENLSIKQQLKQKIESFRKEQQLYFEDQSSKVSLQTIQTKQYVLAKNNKQNQGQVKATSCIFHQKHIFSRIVLFLTPLDISNLYLLNKQIRLILTKSHILSLAIFKAIFGFKNLQIKHFQRHINYFQNLVKKIPEEIIQTTFYQYQILKQPIGGDFMSVLNFTAQMFQGKFLLSQETKFLKSYIESKQITHFAPVPFQKQHYLRIQKSIIHQFFQERKLRKEHVMQQIQKMFKKILNTESLYRADSETLSQFYRGVLRVFSTLFVVSKTLFTEARNLQQLNNFLLAELSCISKVEIEKKYDYEDLKVQVQVERRMKQFLSEKSKKSQERILFLHHQNNMLQTKLKQVELRQNQSLNKIRKLQKKNQEQVDSKKRLVEKYKQLKNAFNRNKEKHNQLIKELLHVKEVVLALQH